MPTLLWIFFGCCACLGISAGTALHCRPWKRIIYDVNHTVFMFKRRYNDVRRIVRRDEEWNVILFYWASSIAVAAAILTVWTFCEIIRRGLAS